MQRKVDQAANVVRRALWPAHLRKAPHPADRALAMARLTDHRPVRGDPEAGPTRQTRRRYRADTLQTLRARGVIGGPELEAAQEIGAIYEGITGSMFARAQRYDSVGGGSATAGDAGIAARLPRRLARAYAERYRPWARWAGEQWIDPGGRRNVEAWRQLTGGRGRYLAIVIDIVVFGMSVRAVAESLRYRLADAQRDVERALVAALRRYQDGS